MTVRPPHPIPHTPTLLAALACAALTLGACTGTDGAAQSAPSGAAPSTTAPSASTTSASATPTDTPDATPLPSGTPDDEARATSPINADQWSTSAQQASARPAEGDGLVFHDLRVAEHSGFYRVVVEFAGAGTPGWNITWADKPIEQGRGRELPVQGSAYLDIAISGTTMPTGSGQKEQYYTGAPSLSVGPVDAYADGTFEDITHLVIGMDRVRAFQVGTLADPVRVVIDVQK